MTYALLEYNKGILNQLITLLGGERVQWYFLPEFWPFILLVVYIWKTVGLSSVIYFAALVGIDKEYCEAAIIDGASKSQLRRHIYIPLITPVITILTILNIGGIIRSDFGMFFNITRNIGVLYPTTDVIDTYVYRALTSVGDIGMSSAVGLFQSVVGFILICVTNFIVNKIEPENSLF
jgi:putative aldouronate transport system permease protein